MRSFTLAALAALASSSLAYTPQKINIGYHRESNGDHEPWEAWVNGQDPCHNKADIGLEQQVYRPDNPCSHRFQIPGTSYQYSFEGCGGDDLWLNQNGYERAADCFYEPGNVPCVAGYGYYGLWQCIMYNPSD